MDWDKLALLSFTENLGYLWPFGVGLMEKSLSVFEWELFEKKVCQKQVFSACEKDHISTWHTVTHGVSLEK